MQRRSEKADEALGISTEACLRILSLDHNMQSCLVGMCLCIWFTELLMTAGGGGMERVCRQDSGRCLCDLCFSHFALNP